MSSFPEPASCLDQLEAGLTALQSGQTERAIAQFTEFLAAQPTDPQTTLKAKMGLVRAYIQTGQTEAAIALCKEVQHSQHEKARSWATQMMTKLAPVETGFVPIDPAIQTTRRQRVQSSPKVQADPKPDVSDPDLKSDLPESIQFPAQSSPILGDLGGRSTEQRSEEFHRTDIKNPAETPHRWRNAGRAQRWQPLPQLNPARSQAAGVGSAIALFSTLCLLAWVAKSISWLYYGVTTRLFQWYIAIPSRELPVLEFVVSLAVLFFASPWIIDAVLKVLYGLKPLSTAAIARHSAETHRLIQRFSQQHKIPAPKLGILPTSAPIALTYGCLPKFARIVVSQGLLDSLAGDEIAAIYAYELGHILHWDFAWMSLVTVAMQIPYSAYRQCAIVSDKLRKITLNHAFVSRLIQMIADLILVISAIAYGFFWLFRWSGLWLSRARVSYGDQHACDLTGNPNGLARALMKTAITTAQTIEHEQRTNDLFESFELLNPISYRSAILFAGLFDRVSLTTLFQWELTNRDRVELLLNSSHALIGDRLIEIMSYGQQWHLQPELEIEQPDEIIYKRNLRQFAPLIGSMIGVTIALLFWLIAQALFTVGIFRFNWIATDYSLFSGFTLIGFGLGTIARFNHFFPESSNVQTDLVRLLTQPDLTPSDSPVIQLEGTLIGRTGAKNQLAQDLLLQTKTGLIKLHYCSQLGAIGNLLCQPPIGQTAIVTGWLRRSTTPWIDVETIRARSMLRGGHQTWSMLSAIATILFGIAQVL